MKPRKQTLNLIEPLTISKNTITLALTNILFTIFNVEFEQKLNCDSTLIFSAYDLAFRRRLIHSQFQFSFD
jgi:hypothetical protein